MRQFKSLVVINTLILSEEARKRLQKYSATSIVYPEKDAESAVEVIKSIGDSEAVIGSWNAIITTEVFDACPSLRYIGICGTNMREVAVEEARRRGITVTNVIDYGDEATAEWIFCQLLNLVRGSGPYQWREHPSELCGKRIGIVGLGAVGRHVARLALGFNMDVSYTSLHRHPEWEDRVHYLPLHDLLASSEIISLHVPKNTRVLGKREFDLIPEGTVLVDTCLGVVFEMDDFMAWIKGQKHFAIFDHKSELYEELKAIPRVLGLDNGTAARTFESTQRLCEKFLKNVGDFLA